MSSSPGELPPEALTDPYVIVSHHTAPQVRASISAYGSAELLLPFTEGGPLLFLNLSAPLLTSTFEEALLHFRYYGLIRHTK